MENTDDELTKLKEIKATLAKEDDCVKINQILRTLLNTKYQREHLIQSHILNIIKQVKDKYNTNIEIKDSISLLLRSWKNRLTDSSTKTPSDNSTSTQISLTESNISNIPWNEGKFSSTIIKEILVELQLKETDPTRKNIKKSIFEILSSSADTYNYFKEKPKTGKEIEKEFLEKLKKMVVNIEFKLFEHFNQMNNFKKYKLQAKTWITNLEKNKEFVVKILNNKINIDTLPTMTAEEMLSEEDKIKKQKIKEEWFDSRRTDWDKLHGNVNVSGLYKCGKCKSTKTTYYQAQIRRADEPMTTFVSCVQCGNNWKC